MKKVAIITINSQNYGNRLQNYALQTVLEKLGCEVTTLNRDLSHISFSYKLRNYIHYIWKTNKTTNFFKFDKLIKWSNNVYNSNLDQLNKEYDFFVAGSDQIWNPYYAFTGTELDFLTFTSTNKKIAYAASFGVSELPEEKIYEFQKKLYGFEKISVREDAGAKIIENLTEKKVPVVLDPTMLLNVEHWRKLEKRPIKMTNEKYTLVYCVESMSDELKIKVEQEKKKGLVLEIKKFENKEWAIGPAEFIYLIDHADKLITDSFHGTVFSILFHTPFVICKRDGINMNSRIDTLLNCFELNDNLTAERFMNADKILTLKREESLSFLKKALIK